MDTPLVGLIIIIVTVITSYKGLRDPDFFDTYAFNVDAILARKDYKRIITSGFLHGSWIHLIFNMYALYSFSTLAEEVGPVIFLLIYFASLIGGSLLSLYINRYNSGYTAIGASGAICGVIFASIAYSNGSIGMLMLPGVSIPAWLYGLIFVVTSIYGIRSQSGNVGHDAHLGGAIVGQLILIAFHPYVLAENFIPIALTIVPSVVFLIFVVRKPAFIVTGSFKQQRWGETKEDRYNIDKKRKQAEVDRILEKIHDSGFDSLTREERDRLDKF